jgi:dipeptidyl aminopeptidase/acylaminoacyl peptidase
LRRRPDGKRLAFESIRHRFEGNIRIGDVDSDGRNQRFLSSVSDYSTTPSWSPDGEQIVHGCERFSGNFGDVCVMDADGSNKRVLVGSQFDEENPALSPTANTSPSSHTVSMNPAPSRGGRGRGRRGDLPHRAKPQRRARRVATLRKDLLLSASASQTLTHKDMEPRS